MKKEDNDKDLALKLTLAKLEKQFPDTTQLNIKQCAKAFGLKNTQSIYNSLRKGATNPFPVKPKRICGRLYWNIIHIAEFLAA